jgi:hypothetical protein
MGIDGIRTFHHTYDEVTEMPEEDQNHHDDEDVPAALKRETSDGPGFDSEDELPESDFESFSEDDVEQTEEDPK